MNAALRPPRMTREQFFDWASANGGRYEFDGSEPIAMTGGTADHNQITFNIHLAFQSRLPGTGCSAFGSDAGVATVGSTVRYPDGLVTCAAFPGSSLLIPGVVVVFGVLSPSSGQTDRILKVREYDSVASIRRYVIQECTSKGLTVLARENGDDDWTATALFADDSLFNA